MISPLSENILSTGAEVASTQKIRENSGPRETYVSLVYSGGLQSSATNVNLLHQCTASVLVPVSGYRLEMCRIWYGRYYRPVIPGTSDLYTNTATNNSQTVAVGPLVNRNCNDQQISLIILVTKVDGEAVPSAKWLT